MYAALTRYLVTTGLESHDTRASRHQNFPPRNLLTVDVARTHEPAVLKWCADNGCTVSMTYAAQSGTDYDDPGLRRTFAEINDRLRIVANAVLIDPSPKQTVAELRAWVDERSRGLPYEGGALNLAREVTALESAVAGLEAPDLGPLTAPSVPKGPVQLLVGMDHPESKATADRMNGFSQEDWARLAEQRPHLRNIVESYQQTLAHQQSTSQDLQRLEARFNALDRILSIALYPFDQRGMNAQTYEVAAEAFARTLTTLERTRDLGQLTEFELLDSLDRQLTLTARWLIALPPIGPRLTRLFERLAGREGLHPYFRLLFAAALDRPVGVVERSLYAALPQRLATRPVRDVPGLHVPVLHYGRLQNFVAGLV